MEKHAAATVESCLTGLTNKAACLYEMKALRRPVEPKEARNTGVKESVSKDLPLKLVSIDAAQAAASVISDLFVALNDHIRTAEYVSSSVDTSPHGREVAEDNSRVPGDIIETLAEGKVSIGDGTPDVILQEEDEESSDSSSGSVKWSWSEIKSKLAIYESKVEREEAFDESEDTLSLQEEELVAGRGSPRRKAKLGWMDSETKRLLKIMRGE